MAQAREYLWQADPLVWAGSAPILFPIVGRLRNDTYEYAGQHYQMPQHGIVRRRDFRMRESTDNSLTLAFESDAESRESFPFDFELTVTFRLMQSRLTVGYTVVNTGSSPMPFTIGSHPAFALHPESTDISDYQVVFSRPETLDRYQLDGTLIGANVQRNYLDNATTIDLHPSIFDNDALIFKQIKSDQVSLCSRRLGKLVTVDTGGAPHLGIWAKPGAPYVCIEPWHGYSDHVGSTGRLQDKLSMKWLDPRYSFDAGYAITLA